MITIDGNTSVESREGRATAAAQPDSLRSIERLAALDRYEILGTLREPGFDGLARLAAEICGTPVGLITFVDDRQQFFKAAFGYAGEKTSPMEVGFCPKVVQAGVPVVIDDTLADPKHATNAAVVDGGVRFYAGVPIRTSDDQVLGTLCVLDTRPRLGTLTERERLSLEALAGQVVSQLELRRSEALAQRVSERAEKHAQRLSLIAEASSLLLAARDPAQTVRDLFELIRHGFQIDIGLHYRCGEGYLGLIAATGLTRHEERAAVRLEFGQTVCGIVAQRREPMHVTNIRHSSEELFRPLRALGLESYFSTPLLAGGDLLGTISFGRRETDFSAGEIAALQTITSQLATSLERLHAEAELRESELRRAGALTAARLGTFEWAPATGAITVDERSREIFGFAPSEGFRAEEIFDRIHPDDVADVRTNATLAIENRTRFEASYRIVLRDGVVRSIDGLCDFVAGDGSGSGRMVGVFTDVTDRRRAELALFESERELHFTLKAGRLGAWTLDLATRALTTSETCRLNFGRDPTDPFSYQQLLDAIHPGDIGRMTTFVQDSIATGADYDIEYRIVTPAGQLRWVLIRAQPTYSGDGTPLKLTGVSADVTSRRREEARKSCLVRLADATRDLQHPDDLAYAAAEILGHTLGASRVGYAIVDTEADTFLIQRDWNAPGIPSLAGLHRLREYGSFIDDLKRGENIAIADVRKDHRTAASASALAALSARSFVNVPVIERGRVTAALYLNQDEPRDWSADDLALIKDVAERTRTAVERCRADLALRDSEIRYRTLFETIESGFCVFDMLFDEAGHPFDYVFVEINPAFEAQTGLVNALGKRISELAPGHEQHWYDNYGEIALTGVPRRFENYARALGRWYEIYAFRVGEPAQRRVAALFNDVSERKQAEARIRELNETLEGQVLDRTFQLRRFRDIVEATTSPICAFDTEYKLVAFNKAHNDEFRRVNGFDTKIGDVFPDLFIAEQQPVMRQLMSRALSGERFTVTEEFGRPELGQPLWEISYTPLRDENGAIIGAFHLATDISERLLAEANLVAAQEALRQSQKMEAMGSLTGGVAHDFNNLLTPIVGSLDMLQRKKLGGEREQRLIANAMQSADRAKTLVQRLLAFARRQPLQPTAVDLAPLVRGMAELVASTTGPQIKVVVDAADGLPSAKADPNQLEMAILNLAVNARDAMPEGGTLRISVDAETIGAQHRAAVAPGAYLRLSVADTGMGMDEATLKRAVEPFFSTKGIGKGTGLGLSMVHGLASQLGGGLTICSTPKVGTHVELWLPQSSASAESETAMITGAAASPNNGNGTVLLVDDEAFVRMITADMLGELGYAVVEASSAEDALKLVDEGLQPDLLVTDHLMPGMTGTDLARTLRTARPGTKVLIVSGYAEAAGIDPDLPRLTKPFRNADLAERLAALG